MKVIKDETDIITIIAASLIGQAVIMYVKIFKADVIGLIGKIILCLMSHRPMIFRIRVSSLILGEINQKMSKFLIKVYMVVNRY